MLMGLPSHSYGTSLAIWDHAVLPATRHKWTRPALTPASKLVLEKALTERKPPPDFQSRDHSILHMSFHVGCPLEPSFYLQPFSRYSALTRVNERTY